MSVKSLDRHNRWRSITVGFRMSPQESEMLNRKVALSGLTKQEYIIRRLLDWEITVRPNSRIYKALADQMGRILSELQRITDGNEAESELQDTIRMVVEIMDGLRGGDNNDKQEIL